MPAIEIIPKYDLSTCFVLVTDKINHQRLWATLLKDSINTLPSFWLYSWSFLRASLVFSCSIVVCSTSFLTKKRTINVKAQYINNALTTKFARTKFVPRRGNKGKHRHTNLISSPSFDFLSRCFCIISCVCEDRQMNSAFSNNVFVTVRSI